MRLSLKAFTLLTVFLFVSCASSTTEKISTQLPLEKASNPDCLDDCDALKKIDSEKLANEVNKDRSVFQIRGLGCNFLQFGTGFFVEKDLLITNAHVVAGVNLPVILYEGKEHVLELVSFDPKDNNVFKSNLLGIKLINVFCVGSCHNISPLFKSTALISPIELLK